MIEPTRNFVESDDGVLVHYLDWGGEAPALILIHGYATCAWVWSEIAEALHARYRSVAIDLAGHGLSSRSPSRYGTSLQTACVQRVIDAIDGPITLVGHSWGGRIAAKIAAVNPRRVSHLVLVDTSPHTTTGTGEILRELLAAIPRSYASPLEYAETLAAWYPLASFDRLRALAQRSLCAKGDGLYHLPTDPELLSNPSQALTQDDQEPEDHLWSVIGRIRCPTLIIRAAYSGILRETDADLMRDTLLDGRRETIENSGHGVMMDNPKDLITAIVEFTSR
jgi:pimeloyl-ACP methyl ester carboxylesterase